MDLPLGEVVAGDERETRGHLPAGKQPAELGDDAWPEAQRRKIVLVDAGVSGERNGGQKLLQRFVLVPLDGLFKALGFFQAEVVPEASLDRIIERELQSLIAKRLRGYAAEKRVGGRGGIRRLRAGSRAGQEHDGAKNQPHAPAKHKMLP